MQKKYQIFVSSTFRDLVDERQDAIRSILDIGHIPAGMELFPASDTEQLAYIEKVIDECDYYVLIMGGRYGSLDEEGVSFTEREYDYAVSSGKSVIAFVHGDAGSIPLGKSDTAPRLVKALNEFRTKVMTGRLVRQWTTREQLQSLVVISLVRAMSDYPAVGWVRASAVASEEILSQINKLRADNDKLKLENEALQRAALPDLIGLAGLDETVSLSVWFRSSSPQGKSYQKDIEFTWEEIFRAIAIRVTSPHSTIGISTFLVKHLQENRGYSYASRMTEDSAAVVKAQLVSLKLIKVQVAQTIKDGSLHEFMTVTDLGKSKLLELITIRNKALQAVGDPTV